MNVIVNVFYKLLQFFTMQKGFFTKLNILNIQAMEQMETLKIFIYLTKKNPKTYAPGFLKLGPVSQHVFAETVRMRTVQYYNLVHHVWITSCKCPGNGTTPVMAHKYTGAIPLEKRAIMIIMNIGYWYIANYIIMTLVEIL